MAASVGCSYFGCFPCSEKWYDQCFSEDKSARMAAIKNGVYISHNTVTNNLLDIYMLALRCCACINGKFLLILL